MHLEGGGGTGGIALLCYILGKASLDHLRNFASRLSHDFLKSQPCSPLMKFLNTALVGMVKVCVLKPENVDQVVKYHGIYHNVLGLLPPDVFSYL